jgi:23S rRNA 5-hydroxycytidine C2501 synthase
MAIPLELLAPAGNVDIGIAAIDHGADAVYIGAPKFSARADAGCSGEDIARLILHAHHYYARVYVALNTIMTDSELPDALEIIREVYELGADGLIIQDTGLLELDLPPIPLIASTQMHNDTPEKIRFLEAAGFKRVIMARELSLDQIAEIRRKTTIELEAFVHGALCVSYSGQCYMSQAVARRSGNRGVCAQPCRSRYTLTDGNGNVILSDRFLLSLKDLNLMTSIPELISAGVHSFKIEGRYKEVDYVKNVTSAYRMAIDHFIDSHEGFRRSSSGRSEPAFSPDPEKTFNRGYTRYFISGRKDKIASMDTQKSIGKPVGTVTGLGRGFFRTDCIDLNNGDGLCFFTKQKELSGFRVDRVEQERIYPNTMKDLAVGIPLYRNLDTALTRVLKKTSARRRISVEMDFMQDDTHIRLTARDEDGNQAETLMELPYEPPRNPSRAMEQAEKQLSSTGNTTYQVMRLNIHAPKTGFIPVSTLNSIKRDVLAKLARTRLEAYPRQNFQFTPNNVPYPVKRLDFRANVLNSLARRFYERHGAVVTEPAFETLPDTLGRTVMTARYCIRHQLDACLKAGRKGRSLREPLRITDGHHTYLLKFDCLECRMEVILEGSSVSRA